MKSLRYLLGAALVALSLGAIATPASAQASRTWVSGVGDDVNPCSRTAPCKTFAGAISKTAIGGEIDCLDPAGFGGVTITKSITIDCTGTLGGVLASSTTGIILNGAGINVTLRGLSLNGGPTSLPGTNGIRFLQGASLIVEDCVIFNFRQLLPNGNGIIVNNTSTTVELLVRNTTIFNNGERGISIVPTGTGGANVTIESSNLSNNSVGVRADTTTAPATTGKINLAINDTVISGNSNSAIVAIGGTGEIWTSIRGVTASSNGSHGIRATGANTKLFLGDSAIVNNGIGTQVDGGATLSSFGTNSINGNTTNGPDPTVVSQK